MEKERKIFIKNYKNREMCNIRERKLMRKGRTAIHKEKMKDLQEGLRVEKPRDVKKKC